MSFDLSTVGFTTKPHSYSYDWKTLATYALGIGAKRDELQYLYEGTKGGMKVYPTFGVVPALFVHRLDIWMVYGISLAFGVVDSFVNPAFNALMPDSARQRLCQSAESARSGSSPSRKAPG